MRHVVRELPPLPPDADLHGLALALEAPALIERGDAPRESWHVIPLAPRAIVQRDDGALEALRALPRGERPDADIPFAGGAVVLLARDVAHEIERLPRTTQVRDAIPRAVVIDCEAALLVPVHGGPALFAHREDMRDADAWTRRIERAIPARVDGSPTGAIEALWSQRDHEDAVRELIEQERAGEIYQANLTQRFEVGWEGSALALHAVLRRTNPSPFSGWIRDPDGEWEVVSGSPERLVRRERDELVTEPIAGTMPLPEGTRTSAAEIARLTARLEASAKDHAEHVMIVDLHRNDLGRVCEPGSVRVERMMRIDRRSHVLQAIADIRGTARRGADAADVVAAMFPGGCVTGVPKIRAMELLDGLERWNRGPYTGSLGFLAPWGDLDLNVLIRSAWRFGSRVAFSAGGGIVLDSDPTSEWRESLAKAQAMHDAVESLR